MFDELTLVAFVLGIFLPVLIDVFAGLRAHRYRYEAFEGLHTSDDFEVLVPIYGNVRYLENIDYLSTYGSRVILCTTSQETDDFYEALDELSRDHGFRVYRSALQSVSGQRRSTSAPIRDRVIRDALQVMVTATYVVCIDADTTTPRPLDELVGELDHIDADIASVRLVPQQRGPMLVRLQQFEYRLAMRLRFIMPWLVSGACHVARSKALAHIMSNHSLFFQGNDVEAGLLAKRLGYNVAHIPFEVTTEVPDRFRAWWRQRIAWSGGEVRLFIANIRYVFYHPFFWMYGAVIVIAFVPMRWYAILHPGISLWLVLVTYYVVVIFLHWGYRSGWLLLMPLYTLFYSLIVVPIGLVTYVHMVISGRNAGIISAKREVVMSE